MTTWLMSPCSTSAEVRGMGVAVMYSRCGLGQLLSRSWVRCDTPNLRQHCQEAAAQPGWQGVGAAGMGWEHVWQAVIPNKAKQREGSQGCSQWQAAGIPSEQRLLAGCG